MEVKYSEIYSQTTSMTLDMLLKFHQVVIYQEKQTLNKLLKATRFSNSWIKQEKLKHKIAKAFIHHEKKKCPLILQNRTTH